MKRLAINGYGRIGRLILRAWAEGPWRDRLQIVGINDLAPTEALAHWTRYDSTHGRFSQTVETQDSGFRIQACDIEVSAYADPKNCPWARLEVDVVLECTGLFTKKSASLMHCEAGAKKVLISAPSLDADFMMIQGVNQHDLKAHHQVVSNGSCTTNCLSVLLAPLHRAFKLEHGLINTTHAYTNDQVLIDASHSDWRRARAASQSMIPTHTGASQSMGIIFPELAGKIDGLAIRVPVANVSLLDFTALFAEQPTLAEIHACLRAAALETPEVLAINDSALVSVDFNHHSASAIVDLTQSKASGPLVKLLAWYDNEWAFAQRMLASAALM